MHPECKFIELIYSCDNIPCVTFVTTISYGVQLRNSNGRNVGLHFCRMKDEYKWYQMKYINVVKVFRIEICINRIVE